MERPEENRVREVEDDEEPQEIVHKLQRAARYAARQKLQEEANESTRETNNESQVQEQRSQIAIIQMAPPAQTSSSSYQNNASTACKTRQTSNTSSAAPSTSKAQGATNRKQGNASSKKKKRHYCSVHGCTYNTPAAKDLVRHRRKHTGEKPFSCDRCDKSFTRFDKLVLHIRNHEGYRPFVCQVCNLSVVDSSSLKKHMRSHTDERPYKCHLCPYAARDASQLTVHTRRHTGDCPYACTFSDCDAAFKTQSDLSRHTRLHTGNKPYKCLYCDYRAAVKCNLNSHMKRHTNPTQKKKGKAKTVAQVIVEEDEREDYDGEDDDVDCDSIGSALPFQYACKLCDLKADTIDQFNAHMKTAHRDAKPGRFDRKARKPRASITNSEQKQFQCTNCTATFVSEGSLRCHMRQHTVPNKPANVAPDYYTPNKIRAISMNAQNTGHFTNGAIENGYTLHELQRVPLVHSVITENPAAVGNSVSITHTQIPQGHFNDTSSSSAQHVMYLGDPIY